MARLVAKTPAEGLLPVTRGTVTLSLHMPEAITSVAPLRGQQAAVERALGQGFPAPGASTSGPAGLLVWSSMGQALLLGPAPGALAGAALCDQSDGWAVLDLTGEDARAVLARLVPADLGAVVFAQGAVARTLLGHMAVCVTRIGPQGYRLMVFRSMAGTAVHELCEAMTSVAARRA